MCCVAAAICITAVWNSAAPTTRCAARVWGTPLQAAELAEIKVAYPAYQDIHSQVLQDVLRRLDKAFAAFFRRIRNGETPGYPRFQGEGRYDSFTYPQSGFALADTRGPEQTDTRSYPLQNRDVKVRLHRPLVGQVKTVTIKRDVNHWYVVFSCAVEEEPLPPCAKRPWALIWACCILPRSRLGKPSRTRAPTAEGSSASSFLQQAKDRKKRGSHRRKRAAITLAKSPSDGCATNERTFTTRQRVPWSIALARWSLKT